MIHIKHLARCLAHSKGSLNAECYIRVACICLAHSLEPYEAPVLPPRHSVQGSAHSTQQTLKKLNNQKIYFSQECIHIKIQLLTVETEHVLQYLWLNKWRKSDLSRG